MNEDYYKVLGGALKVEHTCEEFVGFIKSVESFRLV